MTRSSSKVLCVFHKSGPTTLVRNRPAIAEASCQAHKAKADPSRPTNSCDPNSSNSIRSIHSRGELFCAASQSRKRGVSDRGRTTYPRGGTGSTAVSSRRPRAISSSRALRRQASLWTRSERLIGGEIGSMPLTMDQEARITARPFLQREFVRAVYENLVHSLLSSMFSCAKVFNSKRRLRISFSKVGPIFKSEILFHATHSTLTDTRADSVVPAQKINTIGIR